MNTLLAKYIINQYPVKSYQKATQEVKLQDVNNTPYFTGVFSNELNDFKRKLNHYSNAHINRGLIEHEILENAFMVYNYDTFQRIKHFRNIENKSIYLLASVFGVNRGNLNSFLNGNLEKLSYKSLFRINLIMDRFT